MLAAGSRMFARSRLRHAGTEDVVYPLPIVGFPATRSAEAPPGVSVMTVMLELEERISTKTVYFYCPTSKALDLPCMHYTSVTVKQVHGPDGYRYSWIQFGDRDRFEVINT
jgi:hypothetical protein